MHEMSTYIAGPMTGMTDWNVPAFGLMAAILRHRGLQVINPHEEHGDDFGKPFVWYMRRDLVLLSRCDRVVLLPGWAKSRGATLEHTIAKTLEMEIIYPEHFSDWFNKFSLARAIEQVASTPVRTYGYAARKGDR